jgi:hypothetical protein
VDAASLTGSQIYNSLFFDDNGRLEHWTESPEIAGGGESVGDLIWCLRAMITDCWTWKPVAFEALKDGMTFEKNQPGDEVWTAIGRVMADRKIDATTEEDIARHMLEDDTPEWTDEQLAEAVIHDGGKFIRRIVAPPERCTAPGCISGYVLRRSCPGNEMQPQPCSECGGTGWERAAR